MSFRGCKGDLLEGGIRVPAVMVWPEKIKSHTIIDMPLVTSDYFPIIMDLIGVHKAEFEKPVDEIVLVKMIEGKQSKRNMPLGFKSRDK